MKKEMLISDITKLLDYMWRDEKKHHCEAGEPDGHIFDTLKRIRDHFGLTEYYRAYDESEEE